MSAKTRAKELGVRGISELALFVLVGLFTLFIPAIVAVFWFGLAAGVYTGTWETTKVKLDLLFAKEEAKLKHKEEKVELKNPNPE